MIVRRLRIPSARNVGLDVKLGLVSAFGVSEAFDPDFGFPFEDELAFASDIEVNAYSPPAPRTAAA